MDERIFDIEKVVFRSRVDQETQAEDVSKPMGPQLQVLPDSKFVITDQNSKVDFNAIEEQMMNKVQTDLIAFKTLFNQETAKNIKLVQSHLTDFQAEISTKL